MSIISASLVRKIEASKIDISKVGTDWQIKDKAHDLGKKYGYLPEMYKYFDKILKQNKSSDPSSLAAIEKYFRVCPQLKFI